MTSDKDGYGGWQLGADNRYDIRDDEGGRAREALLGMGCSAAAPAALVKAVCCDTLAGKVGEESIVAVYMVVKPVDEDELGFRGAVREPCFGIEGQIPDFMGSFDFGWHLDNMTVESGQ